MIKYWVASNVQNKLTHDKILGGIESYGFMHGEAWPRPSEASKPEFLHMARPERGRVSLELDCDLESEAGRGLGNYKTFKRVP